MRSISSGLDSEKSYVARPCHRKNPKPMPIDKEITLSILMPCLNEARTLGTCIVKAKSLSRAKEFSLARSSSLIMAAPMDPEIAESLGARVVAVSQRGYGNALQMAGIKAAHGNSSSWVTPTTATISSPGCFHGKLEAGYDLVIGNRFSGRHQRWRHAAAASLFGNPLLTAIGRLLFKSPS